MIGGRNECGDGQQQRHSHNLGAAEVEQLSTRLVFERKAGEGADCGPNPGDR
jgi:hypothetical protein